MKKYLLLFLLVLPYCINAQSDVVITGKIKNFKKYPNKSKFVLVNIDDIAFDDQVTFSTEIAANGSFKIKFPKDHPQDISLEYDHKFITLIVSPGDRLQIEFDADRPKETISFKGDNAKTNQDLKKYTLEKEKRAKTLYGKSTSRYKQQKTFLIDSTAEVFKRYILSRLELETKFYEAFIKQNNLADLFKKWAKTELEYECASDLMSYSRLQPKHDNIKQKDVKLPDNYLDFFDRFPLSNPGAMLSSKYNDYLFEYQNYLNSNIPPDSTGGVSFEDFMPLLLQSNTLTPDEKKRLAAISAEDTQEADIVFLKELFEKNQDLQLEKFAPNIKYPIIEYYLTAVDGFLLDVFFSRELYSIIQAKSLDLAKPYLDTYKKLVKTEAFKSKILKLYEEEEFILNHYTLSKESNIQEKPATEKDSVFYKIIEKYKGKVVYVDFWATWCGPCREEMPHSKKLKDNLPTEDVVFLYLGVESQEKVWKSVIAQLDIKGEHYLLNDREYDLLSAKFKINGIPHYVLIDQQGRIKDDNAKNPGDPQLRREILALLKK